MTGIEAKDKERVERERKSAAASQLRQEKSQHDYAETQALLRRTSINLSTWTGKEIRLVLKHF